MPSTAEGSRRHRSVERRVSCEALEKKWDFSSRTLDGGIKVKAKKGSMAGTEESLGPDGTPADLSMARLANRPADKLKVCQGTTPAASQTDPALRAYVGQLISRFFRFSSQEARPVQFCRDSAYASKNGDCRSSRETIPTDCPDGPSQSKVTRSAASGDNAPCSDTQRSREDFLP